MRNFTFIESFMSAEAVPPSGSECSNLIPTVCESL